MNRPGVRNLRYLVAAAVGAALIVIGLLVFAPGDRKSRSKSEPNIDVLKGVLKKSAEEALPPPTVATDELVLDVPSPQRDAEIERIVAVAMQLGGTALRTESTEGAPEVLAQIPVENASAFRRQINGEEASGAPKPATEGETTELIVVRFRTNVAAESAAESPTSPEP